jgi:hypothetical protein
MVRATSITPLPESLLNYRATALGGILKPTNKRRLPW